MNSRKAHALLSNPQRESEHFGNGGWRPYVAPEIVDRWDCTVGDGAEAIAEALAEPDGWAHQLREWTHSQELCIRKATSARGEYCQQKRYMGLTAAATAWMVIDLRTRGDRLRYAAPVS